MPCYICIHHNISKLHIKHLKNYLFWYLLPFDLKFTSFLSIFQSQFGCSAYYVDVTKACKACGVQDWTRSSRENKDGQMGSNIVLNARMAGRHLNLRRWKVLSSFWIFKFQLQSSNQRRKRPVKEGQKMCCAVNYTLICLGHFFIFNTLIRTRQPPREGGRFSSAQASLHISRKKNFCWNSIWNLTSRLL